MLFTKHIHHSINTGLRLLLCFVLVFDVLSTGVHELKEHAFHISESCSEEAEKDACHRFTFHNEKSDDCDGSHEHLSLQKEDCFACDFFNEKQNDFLEESQAFAFNPVSFVSSFSEKNFTLCKYNQFSLSRGPPVFHS